MNKFVQGDEVLKTRMPKMALSANCSLDDIDLNALKVMLSHETCTHVHWPRACGDHMQINGMVSHLLSPVNIAW